MDHPGDVCDGSAVAEGRRVVRDRPFVLSSKFFVVKEARTIGQKMSSNHDPLSSVMPMTDLALVCDDRTIMAHQYILAIHSGLFMSILSSSVSCQCPKDVVVRLVGVRCRDLRRLLELVYLGSTIFQSDKEVLEMNALLRLLDFKLSPEDLERVNAEGVGHYLDGSQVGYCSDSEADAEDHGKDSGGERVSDEGESLGTETGMPKGCHTRTRSSDEGDVDPDHPVTTKRPRVEERLEVTYGCPECQVTFNKEEQLNVHLSSAHGIVASEELTTVTESGTMNLAHTATQGWNAKAPVSDSAANVVLYQKHGSGAVAGHTEAGSLWGLTFPPDESQSEEVRKFANHCPRCHTDLSNVIFYNRLLHLTSHYKDHIVSSFGLSGSTAGHCPLCNSHSSKLYRHIAVTHNKLHELMTDLDAKVLSLWTQIGKTSTRRQPRKLQQMNKVGDSSSTLPSSGFTNPPSMTALTTAAQTTAYFLQPNHMTSNTTLQLRLDEAFAHLHPGQTGFRIVEQFPPPPPSQQQQHHQPHQAVLHVPVKPLPKRTCPHCQYPFEGLKTSRRLTHLAFHYRDEILSAYNLPATCVKGVCPVCSAHFSKLFLHLALTHDILSQYLSDSDKMMVKGWRKRSSGSGGGGRLAQIPRMGQQQSISRSPDGPVVKVTDIN